MVGVCVFEDWCSAACMVHLAQHCLLLSHCVVALGLRSRKLFNVSLPGIGAVARPNHKDPQVSAVFWVPKPLLTPKGPGVFQVGNYVV